MDSAGKKTGYGAARRIAGRQTRNGHPMTPLVRFLIGMAGLYAAWCALLFLAQRAVLFPTAMASANPDPRPPGEFEVLHFDTPAGTVEGWYRPPPGSGPGQAGPLMIFAHGNAETIDTAAPEMATCVRLGLGLLAVEYPGYGRSAGRPSQASIAAAMLSAYDRIRARPEVDPGRIVACGRSLGGAAACLLADRRPLAALILISSFTRVRAFTRRYLVPSFLVRDPFDNLSVLDRFKEPVLIVHGTRDTVIPVAHGRALHQSAADSRLVLYPCDHNDCPPDDDLFWRDVGGFLADARVIREML